MAFKKCIYCGSMCHSNADCTHPSKAETMVKLYGSGSASEVVTNPRVDLNSHTMGIYAQAVEQDRLFFEELKKTMTPEQLNKFCFENGFAVPVVAEYIPSPEEVTEALADADVMNFNMRTYGTIDAPKPVGVDMRPINDCFLAYYVGKPSHVAHSRPMDLRQFLSYAWAALPRSQAILTAMQHGYAMCVVVPKLDAAWVRMDAGYAEFQAGQERAESEHEFNSSC